MTAEEVMEKVRESMNVALRQFYGQKNDGQTKAAMRSAILNVLHNYYLDGTIDIIPMVDINHETEIAYLANQIREKYLEAEGTTDGSKLVDLLNSISILAARMDILKSAVDETRVQVFVKDPLTFNPFIWHGRSDYEQ